MRPRNPEPALAGAVKTSGRLIFVDGLRGVAAAMVVIEHLFGRIKGDFSLPASLMWPITHGYLGVAIFFVLSGFVISMSVGNREISPGFLGRFALRRALRLDPPYWASIATALGLAGIAAVLFDIPKAVTSPPQVAAHLVYLQDLLGYDPILPVFWTLCLEIQFYIFLILLLWAMQTLYRRSDTFSIAGRGGFHGVLMALLIWSVLELNDVTNVLPAGTFIPYWYAFTLGTLAYWTSERRVHGGYLASSLGIVSIGAIAFGSDWCVAAVATAGLLFAAGRLGKMRTWLAGDVIQFLGRISYSLYLFHATVGWSAMSFAMKLLGPQLSHLELVAAALVGVCASVIAAWIAYVVIERHSVRLSHWVRLETTAARPLMAQSA